MFAALPLPCDGLAGFELVGDIVAELAFVADGELGGMASRFGRLR